MTESAPLAGDEPDAPEPLLWRLGPVLGVGYVAAFLAAGATALLHHLAVTVAIVVTSNIATLLWIVALIATAARFTRSDGAR